MALAGWLVSLALNVREYSLLTAWIATWIGSGQPFDAPVSGCYLVGLAGRGSAW